MEMEMNGIELLDCEPEDVDLSYVRYRPEGLQALCENTKFSKKEIQLMYRGFKQVCPSGIVNLDQFKEIYSQFFPQGDPNLYAGFVFNTFDRDRNGQISFDEFVSGLSVLCRGTTEDKLKWVFKLYDQDNDGLLTKFDIERVVRGVYDMMGKYTQPPIEEKTVKEHIEFVNQKLDKDGMGISLPQFLHSCLNDEDIRYSIGLFDTIL